MTNRQTPAPANFLCRSFRLPTNVLVISLVSFLNDASSEIIYPLLPVFLFTTLAASPAAIGLIEGAAESTSSLLKLFSGYWSDRRGRRKGFVVFGYTLASVARPLLGLATSWLHVLVLRFSDRIGKGIRSAPRDAMIADSALPGERGLAFGFHRAMDHAGAVVGPLLAYLFLQVFAADPKALTATDYRQVFLFASVPAACAVLVAAFFIKERKPKKPAQDAPLDAAVADTELAAPAESRAKPRPLRLSLRGFDGNFKRFLFVIALFTLSNSTDAFLLLRAKEVGLSSSILLLWAALHVCKVVSSVIGGNLSDRFGRKRLIVSGWLVYAAVYAGFAYATTSLEIWALFLVYGTYFGLVEGAEKALVADLVRPEQRGTAYGLYNLAFGITVLPASFLFGEIWKWQGASTAFLTSAAVSLLATLLLLSFVKTGKSHTVPLAT